MREELYAAAWLLLVVALSACTEEDSSLATTTVVDSAGILIVTNALGSIEAAKAWSLAPDPVVDIGSGASPEVPLFRVTDVVPLDGDRVAVGTNGPPRALVFEPDGTLAATLGREGEGPGEFSSVASIVPLGTDSLAVWDQNRRRMSVFTEEGRFVREVDLSELVPPSPLAAPSLEGLSAFTCLLPSTPGSLLLFSVGMTGPGLGVRRVEVPSHRITTGGEQVATFGPFPGEETFNFGAGKGGVFPYPFSANTYGATAGDAVVVGTAEAPEFRLYDSTGALARIVRWPDHDRTVAGPLLADWNEFVDGWLAERSPGEGTAIRQLLDRVPLRERFPAYDGLITADSDEIWVGAYAGEHSVIYPPRNLPPPARRWLVFDIDGGLKANVETPEGFQPQSVREGRVWGVFKDELEVESVRAYDIVRL